METRIPDFTDTELWTMRSTLTQRYGHEVPVELADAELRLEPEARELASCPSLFWSERSANFVQSKVGETAYRCLFYYRGFEQYGTGRETYDDLSPCVITLLQVQAGHEREKERNPAKPDPDTEPQEPTDSNTKPLFWGD